ncbi:MAG: efflux RND transporter permease subunit, partial [Deltaproteobacteria bacterium]|nr:efflux RND transporter permease subunit [Deltaproteobacteria bacterium]
MFLSDVAIRRPVFTAMMSIAILVFGLLAYRTLPVDQYPPVDFPIMLVQTVWPGASPADMERDVTREVEDAVASVPGLDKLQSFSRESLSIVVLQFELGTPLADASATVRDRLGPIERELPSGVEAPIVRRIELNALPVMVVAVSAPGGVDATRFLADERIRPRLEQVGGVGSVAVVGGRDREIRVDLDLDALRGLGIAPSQVAERLGWENLSLPVGEIEAHGFAVGIRAEGRFRSVEDLASTVVHGTPDGQQVRLSEVARVLDDHADLDRYVRFNGAEAVSLEVVKRSGANTVAVAHEVRAALAELQPTLGSGVSYEVIWDQSADIEANAHEVWVAIWFGGAMAVGVILFFLLDVRGTLISALALPTSVIGTFMAMGAFGFSLNTMTLLGLSLAIGLLIDDAVVVREAITRRLEQGDSPAVAASRGTAEIALAVVATTLSLVAVFVPVAFMSGIVGQFFKQFGLTIAVAVLLSLFVAFTLDPMLSARFSVARTGPRRGIARAIERFLEGVDELYRRMLGWVLRFRFTTAGLAVLILLCSGVVAMFVPVEFVPEEDRGEFFADLRLPIGTSLETTGSWAQRLETDLAAIPGVERIYTVVGYEDHDNYARFRIRTLPKEARDEPLSHFQDAVRGVLTAAPSAEVSIAKPGIIEGLGDWPPLMVQIQGDDLAVLAQEAERVRGILAGIEGTQDVRVQSDPGRPELHVEIDRAIAADRGVPAGLVASTARLLVEGQVVGALQDGGEQADIRVRADPRFSLDEASIARLPIPSARGLVTLGDVANVRMGSGPSEIQRLDRMRAITVSTQLAPGAALGAIDTELEERLAAEPMADGTFFVIDGQARDMAETGAAMGLAVSIALACIFMVLASQFESLVHPVTLLVSVPLGMVGSIFALALTGSSLSMGSQIGMILLMGLVTKNAILLVDGALTQTREASVDAPEAMRRAGPRRLRPILMTSAAMVLGMVPTAIGTGVGAEFRAPMAIAVIGGVISSTFLTLLVVPV